MTHRKHPRSIRRRAVQLTLSLALVFMVGGYFALNHLSGCTYTITDGDQVTQITTSSVGTDHVLLEAGITLAEGDKVSVTGGSAQKTITISRGQNVTVNNGGKSTSTVTYGGTIGDLLGSLSITLGAGDTITADGSPASTLDSTYDGMTLEISRNRSTTATTTQSVPYETISYLDPTIPVGETKVQTSGVDGSREVTTELVYQNGELVSSDVISSRIVTEPQDEVILIGAQQVFAQSDTGEAQQPAQDDEAEAAPESDANSQTCDDRQWQALLPLKLRSSLPRNRSLILEPEPVSEPDPEPESRAGSRSLNRPTAAIPLPRRTARCSPTPAPSPWKQRPIPAAAPRQPARRPAMAPLQWILL